MSGQRPTGVASRDDGGTSADGSDGARGGPSQRSSAEAEPPSPDEVRAQLHRIVGSPAFEGSERQKRFLCYVVDELLAARADRLKGYSIALAVFDRADSFDPQTDPVVRLEARRLRRALEHYYLTVGRADPIRIEIPKGGYAPVCERQDETLVASVPLPPAGAGIPAEAPTPPPRATPHWLVNAGVGLVLVVAVITTTAWFWLARTPADPDGPQAATAVQLEGPAVVVAPFADLTGSESGRLFASGFTQELITDLMRFTDLRVYAMRNDEAASADPGQRPDVRFVVQGAMRRTPDRLHLVVHLNDLASGRYLWSESYDRPLTTENVFAVQEELATELAGRLAEPYGIVHKVSADLFRRHRPQTLAGYECVLRTFAYRRTFSRELYAASRDCLDDTVRLDRSYPEAWAMLAYAHLDEYRWYGFGPLYRQPEALEQALAAARAATELDPDNVTSLSAFAAVQYYRGEFDDAESAQRRAVALNPNNPEALAQLGWRVAFVRDWDEGIGLVRQATQTSLIGSGWYYLILAFDSYRHDDYTAALANARSAGELGFFGGAALVAMCEAHLGHPEAARQALARAIAIDPTFAEDPRGAFRLHHVPEDLIDRFVAGLRKAGLEDPAA